jgi:hypothetical protein
VSFDEEKHEYWYKGKQLSGITGLISKKLGLKLPKEFLEEHQEEGIHVHKAIQQYINKGVCESVHPGVRWLIDRWSKTDSKGIKRYSEVLVSDFRQYASAIDIVDEMPDGTIRIYDIKKGIFKRDYVTWQLSVYKFLAEIAGKTVTDCLCICLRDPDVYQIFPKKAEEVEKLLYS